MAAGLIFEILIWFFSFPRLTWKFWVCFVRKLGTFSIADYKICALNGTSVCPKPINPRYEPNQWTRKDSHVSIKINQYSAISCISIYFYGSDKKSYMLSESLLFWEAPQYITAVSPLNCPIWETMLLLQCNSISEHCCKTNREA